MAAEPWTSGDIFGNILLPPGYGLAILPADSKFESGEKDSPPFTLSCGYNAIGILVSIGQLIFASSTLYLSRGDQINRFGYAAFGLTVIQYALMSLLNLFGNLMCPQYPTLYLVESRAMLEARTVPGALFEGAVGRLIEDDAKPQLQWSQRQRPPPWWKVKAAWIRIPFALIPPAITIAIIGSLSHFHAGSSTYAQRAWVMAWLAVGSYVGLAGADVRPGRDITQPQDLRTILVEYIITAIGAAPAVGGFVVVGQILQSYGVCTRIS